jgi:hypothetical protein
LSKADAYDLELAWLFTRELIGHGLRRRYEVAKDLPRELLELVGKLDAGDRNYSMRADNPSEMDLLLPSISWKKDSDRTTVPP